MSAELTLCLLGGATLRRGEGVVTGRAAQRRRLALLALLARAPGRTVARDRLISILWPESETDDARHLLTVAVYDLRRALGPDALLSRADELELGGIVSVDVDAFVTALATDDLDAAIAAYTGPFLDAFHISDAPGFEHWLDAERDGLARRYAAATESLARRLAASGEVLASAALWRRLAALDPYNSRIALALMQSLDAAGDRAAAIHHARVHSVMLREEFGADPDAAVQSLMERLRTGGGAPAIAPRSEPTAALQSPNEPVPGLMASPAHTPDIGAMRPSGQLSGHSSRRRTRGSTYRGTGAHRTRTVMLAAATGALVLLAGVLWYGRAEPRGAAQRTTAEVVPSIAVLPFRDLGVASEHALLGNGLSEEIISTLGRAAGLRVAAATSSFLFRDAVDVRQVGDTLGVSHVLEGTVRGTTDQLTVTARLIDSGTGYEVWTQSFQAPLQMKDISAVQDEIAQSVMRALQVELIGPNAAAAPRVAPTDNMDALYEYIEGRSHLHRRTVQDVWTALQHFQRAVEIDTTYALAWAMIAESYSLLGAYDYGMMPPRPAYTEAGRAAERALQLQPDLAEAYTALASVHFNFNWDWDAADAAFRRAHELNPGYAPAWHWHSLLHAARGRMDEARSAVLRSAELDPLSLVTSTAMARQYYFARDFPRAIAQYQRTLAVDSSFVTARLGLGLSLLQAGRTADAIAEFQAAERLIGATLPVLHGLLGLAHGRAGNEAEARLHLAALQGHRAGYFPPEYLMIVHLGLDDLDGAFEALEQALENRSGGIAYLRVEPLLDPLRTDPRFRSLLVRAGL